MKSIREEVFTFKEIEAINMSPYEADFFFSDEPASEMVVVSPDGKWEWRLSNVPNAKITLYDRISGVKIDDFIPDNQYARIVGEGDLKLESWIHPTGNTYACMPDMIILFFNCGDSFMYLFTLKATPEGIVDPVGFKLYEMACKCLDETINNARFLSQDRFLILDDVGMLHLISWPECSRVEIWNVKGALENEDYSYTVWPEDEPREYLDVPDYLFLVEDVLLAAILDGDNDELLALACFNASDLKPTGLIRPPMKSCSNIIQYSDRIFKFENGKTESFFELVDLH